MQSLSKIIQDFLAQYPTLSKAFRKVFRFIQGFARKFRTVYPSVETISNGSKVSMRHTKRATAFFHDMAWVIKCKRGFTSNVYIMMEDFIDLNLDDSKLFLRPAICPEKRPLDGPVYKNNNVYIIPNSGSGMVDSDHFSENPALKKVHIPYFLKNIGLTDYEQHRLVMNFSEFQLADAVLEDLPWYKSMGHRIKTMMGFIWSRAASKKKSV